MPINWTKLGAAFRAAVLRLLKSSADAGREVLEEAAKDAAHAALDPFVEEGIPAEVEAEIAEIVGDSDVARQIVERVDTFVRAKAEEGLTQLLTWAEGINPADNAAA
jgi:hypothetical protein